jgi:hypothetical protein
MAMKNGDVDDDADNDSRTKADEAGCCSIHILDFADAMQANNPESATRRRQKSRFRAHTSFGEGNGDAERAFSRS